MSALLLNVAALIFAASVHEDVAILMAAYFVLERQMPVGHALLAVYTGSVLNNYALYGLGMLARRAPGLRRWLIDHRVEAVRQRLKRRLVSTLTVCRVIPGSLSPVVLGCGWLGVPFARFALTVAVTAAAYVALLATLVLTVGQDVVRQLSQQPWLAAGVLGVLVLWLAARHVNRSREPAR
jgi:membrane protein DedA with SNARE-associated domain